MMDADFHFHEWAFLASADPQLFERRRAALIEAFMRQVGHRRPALESLQREIDRQRASAASPEQAVAAISGMMCDSFCTLVGELRGLRSELQRLGRSRRVGGERRAPGCRSRDRRGRADAAQQGVRLTAHKQAAPRLRPGEPDSPGHNMDAP